jgi:WD40 repeat protein
MHSNDSKDTIRCFRLTRGQHRSGIMAVPALNSVLWELILFFCCPSFRNLTCSCWQASAEQKSQRQWAPPPLREGNGYGSSDTEYPYSGSDDDVSDGPYSDDNSDDIQPSARSSGESSGESEVDQVEVSEGQQAMDITIEDSRDCASETAVRPQSEGMPMETTRASTSQVPLDILAFDVNTMHRLLDPHEDRGRAVAEISNEDFAASSSFVMTETASLVHEVNERASFRLHSASGEGASDRGTGSSGDEGEEQCTLTAAHTALSLGITGTRHVSPICYENHYREFMIATLPGLQVLDNVAVTYCERERARSVCKEHFELVANNRREPENVIQVLKRRETGGWGVGATSESSKLGFVDHEHSSAAFTRSLCSAKMASCSWPATTAICKLKRSTLDLSHRCRPRQFEYHPTEASYMVFGTLHGEVVVVNHESDKVVGYVQSIGAPHSILGLCWLNKDPNKLIAGSDNGSLQLYDVNHMRASMVTAVGRRGGLSNTTRYESAGYWGQQSGGSVSSRVNRSPTIHTYDDFEQLTSVHINSTDDYFLASGYAKHVGLYDLRTGTQLQIFPDLHQEHINVVKFAHHSPYLFATSSFDKDIKMWDIRQKVTTPIYTAHSTRGNVMVCFSHDDHYLLSSAVDNEVRQHLAVDGRLHLKFDIAPTRSIQNYTRSYYLNNRDYIITGSCEENIVRVCCAQTGRRLRDLSLEGRGLKNSLYVQSLRGDPFKDFHFCVLVAYNHPHSKSEIVKVNLLTSSGERKGHGLEHQHASLTGMGG